MTRAEPTSPPSVEPIDSLDLPTIRDGSRRRIPWNDPIEPLDDARRAKLVHAWSWRREQEHLAVGSFTRLAYEAAAYGCEPATLALLTRAATDEVHHADVCRRVVEKHTGQALPRTLRGVPRAAQARLRDFDELLLTVVETCCLSETLTGAYFTDMLEVATTALARAVVLSLLEDEIDHGRVGWAFLAAARRDGAAGSVAAALPELLERTVGDVFRDAREQPEPDDPLLDAAGYVGRTRGARVDRDALETIVLPGFDALDIDTRAARETCRARGWI